MSYTGTYANSSNGNGTSIKSNSKTNGSTKSSSSSNSSAGACQSICTLLVGILAILLSGAVNLSYYPPKSFPRVSIHDEFLSEAGGNFTYLSKGRVHYVLREPAEPSPLPPVVLVHGFSMGCVIWNDIAEALVERGGRRVLAFDLFGRGYSDAAFPCDLELFTGQLSELLFSLQPILGPGPYDIFGTSMGGAIAVHFTHLYPQHVRQLVLLAPAGLPVHVPFTALLGKLPLIGDIFMPLLGPISLKTHARKGHAHPDDPALKPIFAAMGRRLMRQTKLNPGFFPALLSTLRNFPLNELEWAYESIGKTRREGTVLVVWGDKDEVTPFTHAGRVLEMLEDGRKKVELLVLTDCGHVDALEVPRSIDEMVPPLIKHLAGEGLW